MTFTKRKPSPVLDNEVARWEVVLRDLAAESPMKNKGMKVGVEAMG